MFCFTKSLPTLYIPSLLTNCKECFSERKPQKTHLRVRDCYTYNHLHISLWFSSTSTSPSLNPCEVDSPNTYHTLSECQMRFWCCWEALEGSHSLANAIGLNCRIRKSQIRQGFEKPVGSRSLEGSSTLGRLGLEGLLLFVYSNFIL